MSESDRKMTAAIFFFVLIGALAILDLAALHVIGGNLSERVVGLTIPIVMAAGGLWRLAARDR